MRTYTPVAATLILIAGGIASAQSINEDTVLLAGDAAAGDQFGFSVGASQGIAIAGSVLDDDSGANSGAAYLFDVVTGQQTFKLVADDAAALDQFGWSVAISGDIAIVGARLEDGVAPDSGSAYLFNVTTGEQIAKLLPSDGAAGDQFGYAVAIFGDVAIVGAPLDDDAGANSGSAYLFDVTTGQQIAKLVPSDGAGADQFGSAVGVSESHAVVGALGGDDNGANSGAAYLFSVTTGQQTSKLLPSDGSASDQFGFSVAIADDTAIIGSLLDDDNGLNSGSAYLFNVPTATQIGKLVAADGSVGDQFGYSVAIGGGLASVGARFDDDGGTDSGSAYFFDAETGDQLEKIVASNAGPGDQFGYSVSVAPGAAVFGAPFEDSGGSNAGAAYFIELEIAEPCFGDADGSGTIDLGDLNLVLANFGCVSDNAPSVEEGAKLNADGPNAFASFGYAIASSGSTSIIGARNDSPNGQNSGRAYLFDTESGTQTAELVPADNALGDRFGNAVAIDSGRALVGAEGDDTAENGDSSGSAYLFDAADGSELLKFLADDGEAGDQLGFAVALSGDHAVVSAPGDGDNGVFSGSVYIFDAATGTQSFKLLPDDPGAEDRFGYAVAVSGNTVLVGALFDDDNGNDSGSAYLFDATTGAQIMKLTPDDAAANDLFGSAVAIIGDTALISAIGDNDAAGAVYLFSINTGNQLAKITADDATPGDSFGLCIAASDARLIVGSPGDEDAGNNSGSAYLFDLVTNIQMEKLIASDSAAGDLFGFAVAIAGDTIGIGAHLDDDGAAESGSVYLYNILPVAPCEGDVNADGATDLADLNAVLAAFGQVCP